MKYAITGLLEIGKHDSLLDPDQVQFIHQFLVDYLVRYQGLQRLTSAPTVEISAASHEQLRACCMGYIMNDSNVSGVVISDMHTRTQTEDT